MTRRSLGLVPAALAIILAATACGGDNNNATPDGSQRPQLSGSVVVDGSSTVAPLSEAAADLYREEEQQSVQVTVGTSGTGAGFEKFCNDETDISDASRAIEDDEKAACVAKSVEFFEFTIALDALSVVVHNDNNWATCLTVAQLKSIWDQGSSVDNWKDVDPAFPDAPLTKDQLFGPGTDSGTFDYFTGAINGEEGQSRTNYTPSENDNVLVQGVSGDKNAMGYFGLSYVLENEGKIKALQVDGGAGCVAPTAQTAQDGTYKPLARPLYIYVKKASATKPQVMDFVRYYIENLDEITQEAGFVSLNATQKGQLQTQFQQFSQG